MQILKNYLLTTHRMKFYLCWLTLSCLIKLMASRYTTTLMSRTFILTKPSRTIFKK